MTEQPLCPSCGAKLPSGTPDGLCPKCLLMDAVVGDGEATPFPDAEETTLDAPTPNAAAHPNQIAPYKILETLGEGGMGIVYLRAPAGAAVGGRRNYSGRGSNRTYQIMKADSAVDGSARPDATRDPAATTESSRRLSPVRVRLAGMRSS